MNDPRNRYDEPTGRAEHEAPAGQEASQRDYSNVYNPQARGPEAEQRGAPPQYGYYGQPVPPPARPPADYARYGQYGDYREYHSYQYNPNTGWQQADRREKAPERAYEWNPGQYSALDRADRKSPQRKRGSGIVIFSMCLLLLFSGGLVGITVLSLMSVSPDSMEAAAPAVSSLPAAPDPSGAQQDSARIPLHLASRPQTPPAGALADGRLTTPQIAQKVTPSVVSVVRYTNSQLLEPTGLGSGIILSEEGYIITNAHVISGGTDFKVHLYSGVPYDAELIGYDNATDLAVLRISAPELQPAEFGDSNELSVGETVVAIGNPVNLEFAGSVTQGIVSALHRKVDTTRYAINYIQTDAAINPGNSGGALVNEFGQVIGINVAKIGAAGYEGMCFAIPISEARPIIEDLLNHGHVTGRVMLGIRGGAIDEFDAKRTETKAGVLIESIDPNSDLAGKDVQKGDIITHIDGERIYTVGDIYEALDGRGVGEEVELILFRKISTTRSREITVRVKLMEDAQ